MILSTTTYPDGSRWSLQSCRDGRIKIVAIGAFTPKRALELAEEIQSECSGHFTVTESNTT